MSELSAEFIGTALLILFGNGVVANLVLKDCKGNDGGWLMGAVGWCLAVVFAVYAVGHVSGAHLNPAVTFGLACIGEFSWTMLPGYMVAQLLGAFFGAVLVYLVYLPHWGETEAPADKLACFATAPAIRQTTYNFMTEFIATGAFVFGVLVIGALPNNALGADAAAEALSAQEGLIACFKTWFGPLLVGMLVMAVGLSLGGPTGYAINPARDLGPRIAHAVLPIVGKGHSDWDYSWLPVFAPLAGGMCGAFAFRLAGL